MFQSQKAVVVVVKVGLIIMKSQEKKGKRKAPQPKSQAPES